MALADETSDDTALTDDDIHAVTEAVVEAGRHALEWFRPSVRSIGRVGSTLSVDNKLAGGFDPVTEADRAVERLLRASLSDRFPDHAVTGEEYGSSGTSRFRWFIDPVDGTRAFVTGQPMWGTLVGLCADGRPIAGWMHLPVLGETYVGLESGTHMMTPPDATGAQRRVELSTTSTSTLADAVVLSTHPSMFAPGPEMDGFSAVGDAVKMVRFGGDCMNYGLLASGDADLVIENQLQAYDIVPLIPIITGAGGVVTNLDGEPPVEGGFVVAAATAELHAEALALLTNLT